MTVHEITRIVELEQRVECLEESVAGLVALFQVVAEMGEVKRTSEERASELLAASRIGRLPSPLMRFRLDE